MDKVLLNTALFMLTDYCRESGIDCSGSRVSKDGRGYRYKLVRDEDGRTLATCTFSKHNCPVLLPNPN